MARVIRAAEYDILIPRDIRPGEVVEVVVVNRRTGQVETGRMRMVPDEDGSYRTAEAILAALGRDAPRD